MILFQEFFGLIILIIYYLNVSHILITFWASYFWFCFDFNFFCLHKIFVTNSKPCTFSMYLCLFIIFCRKTILRFSSPLRNGNLSKCFYSFYCLLLFNRLKRRLTFKISVSERNSIHCHNKFFLRNFVRMFQV